MLFFNANSGIVFNYNILWQLSINAVIVSAEYDRHNGWFIKVWWWRNIIHISTQTIKNEQGKDVFFNNWCQVAIAVGNRVHTRHWLGNWNENWYVKSYLYTSMEEIRVTYLIIWKFETKIPSSRWTADDT